MSTVASATIPMNFVLSDAALAMIEALQNRECKLDYVPQENVVKGPLLTLVNIASVANALDPQELPSLLKRLLPQATDIDEAIRVWPEVSAALLRCAKQDARSTRSVEIPADMDPALFVCTRP